MTKYRGVHLDKEVFLKSLGDCRRAITNSIAAMPTHSGLRLVSDDIVNLIDDAAAILTGDRQLFWAKGPGPSSLKPTQD